VLAFCMMAMALGESEIQSSCNNPSKRPHPDQRCRRF
jgi:hypothetical protein